MKRSSLAKKIAVKAGKIILGASASNVNVKEGRGNLVTDIDLQCESLIIAQIKKYFPNDNVVSEETENKNNYKNFWLIDPLDGTNNFVHDRHYSAVSIAYLKNKTPVIGAIYNPYTDELFFAEADKGASLNGDSIFVSQKKDLENSYVATDNGYTSEKTEFNIKLLLSLKPVPWSQMKGSAALVLSEIATGRLDLYFHSCLEAWDKAAAFVIIKEAGGTWTDLYGKNASYSEEQFVTGNKHLVQRASELFKKGILKNE